MSELFLRIFNLSISASWLVLCVVFLRLILRRMPKWFRTVLWGLVGLRLALPFSIESALSLVPSAETVSPDILYARTPAIESGVPAVNAVLNPVISGSFTPAAGASVNPLQIWVYLASNIWIAGMLIMFLYTAVSYVRLRSRVRTAVRLRDDLYQSEYVTSPFVMGLFHPRIYLPYHLPEETAKNVIAHEQAHIRRHDHIIKPVGYLLLSIYWFNPILWAAYILMCRDIELACDERVIRKMSGSERADYSQALLSCSIPHRIIPACPLAFGEVGVKARVKNVLNYKKPAFWVIAAGGIVTAAAAVCFLTTPRSHDTMTGEQPLKTQNLDSIEPAVMPQLEQTAADPRDAAITAAIMEYNAGQYPGSADGSDFSCESHIVLATEGGGPADAETAETVTVYIMALYQEYSFSGGAVRKMGGSYVPAALTFTVDGEGAYRLEKYWTPRDGSYYTPDLRAVFPGSSAEDAIDSQKYILALEQNCYAQAVEYGKADPDAF